jgi:hypothetical protein
MKLLSNGRYQCPNCQETYLPGDDNVTWIKTGPQAGRVNSRCKTCNLIYLRKRNQDSLRNRELRLAGLTQEEMDLRARARARLEELRDYLDLGLTVGQLGFQKLDLCQER